MPTFDYRAVDPEGKTKTGQISLSSKQDAVKYLTSQNLFPVKLKEKKQFRVFNFKSKRVWLLNFTEYLANLLEARIELLKALYIIAESYEDEESVEFIYRLIDKIKKGSSFSEAISDEPYFDELYVTLVRVGEEGGNLAYTVNKLYEHLQSKNETFNFLVSSMIYPVVLLSTTLLAAFVLLIYVLPKFGEVFSELQQDVPLFTALLIDLGEFLKVYTPFILIAAVILFFVIKRNQKFLSRFRKFVERLPFIGNMIFLLDIKNFFQSMSILLYGGHPFLHAFSLSKTVVKMPELQQSLNRMLNQIKQGQQFSQLMRAEGIFSSDIVNLVAISEETGKSAEIFNNISSQLEKKTKQKISKFLNILEPATIIIMGLFIGAVVMSMLSAIFGINDVQL